MGCDLPEQSTGQRFSSSASFPLPALGLTGNDEVGPQGHGEGHELRRGPQGTLQTPLVWVGEEEAAWLLHQVLARPASPVEAGLCGGCPQAAFSSQLVSEGPAGSHQEWFSVGWLSSMLFF